MDEKDFNVDEIVDTFDADKAFSVDDILNSYQDPNTAPEQQEERGILGYAGDMLKGVGEGAVKAVEETAQFGYDVVNWFDDVTGLDAIADRDFDFVPEWLETETGAGKAVSGISRFLTGFVGAGKVLKAAKIAGQITKLGKAAKYIQPMAQGALTDAIVYDPHEERLSNLLVQFPMLDNPVTQFLAADETDGKAEGRFKNALEGMALGGITDGIFALAKGLKRGKFAKTAEEFLENTVKTSDEIEAALKKRLKVNSVNLNPDVNVNAQTLLDAPEVTRWHPGTEAKQGVVQPKVGPVAEATAVASPTKGGKASRVEALESLGLETTDQAKAFEKAESIKEVISIENDELTEKLFRRMDYVAKNGRPIDPPPSGRGYQRTDAVNTKNIQTDAGKNLAQAVSDVTRDEVPPELLLPKKFAEAERKATAQFLRDVYGGPSLLDRLKGVADTADTLDESTIAARMLIDDAGAKFKLYADLLEQTPDGPAAEALTERLMKILEKGLETTLQLERISTGMGRGLNSLKDTSYLGGI